MLEIGKIHVKTPIEKTQRYEVACWYTKHLSDTGIFPVFYMPHNYVHVKLPSTIIDDFTPSLFGGVMVGKGNSNTGAKSSFDYSYPMPEAIIASGGFDGDPHWAILPEHWHIAIDYLTIKLQEYKTLTDKAWEKGNHSVISCWSCKLSETARYLEKIEDKKRWLKDSPEYIVNYDLEGLSTTPQHILLERVKHEVV